jgi:hypothetical protein
MRRLRMKRIGIFLSLMVVLLSSPNVYAQSYDDFTSEERQFLDHLKQGGASEEQIKEFMFMLKVKHGENKQWSEKELKDLDRVLTSKWEGMRRALELGNIDTAVSFICKKNRDIYRETFSKQTKEQLLKMSKDFADIKMIKVQGSHYAEYDIQKVKDGKKYSYMLVFEKNRDDIWEIISF